MNHGESPNPELLDLDRYLDGQMSPPERSAFEARMREEPDLRHDFELQRRVDAAITSLRGPIPAGIDIDRVLARSGASRFRWRRWILAAALVLLATAATYFFWPPSMPVRIYTREVAAGLVPAKVCKDDDEFRHYTQERFGRAFTLADVPSNLEIIGWKYDYAVSPTMSMLLARYDGQPIVVLIDAKKRMIPIEPGVYGKLHVMRHDYRGLSFIEISPKRCFKVAKRFQLAAEFDTALREPPARPVITNSN